MRKLRQFFLGAGLVVTFAVVVVAIYSFLPNHRINEKSFRQLKIGMHQSEVDALFGVPSGDHALGDVNYGSIPSWGELEPDSRDVSPHSAHVNLWIGNWAVIAISFDANDRVNGARFKHARPALPWE